MEIQCIFSEPILLGIEPKDEDWEYSKMECFATSSLPLYLEKVVSEDQEKEFFLEKTISYGDFLITSFFILLLLGLVVFGIRDFVKNRKLERL